MFNNFMLSIYYYNGAFDGAYLSTTNGAGKTYRKISRGQTAVYKLWFEQQENVKQDIYEKDGSRIVFLSLNKIL